MKATHKPLEPGQVIHHFTVIQFSHSDKRGRRHYLCRCRCGIKKTVQRSLLTSGNTRSCGCWSREAKRLRCLPHGIAARNLCYAGYRYKAAKSGIPFAITKEQFSKIATLPCFYCGCVPSNVCKSSHGTGDFVYTGIDRIQPKRGYTASNTVPACHRCNFAKSDRAQGEFIAWIGRAYLHLRKTAMAQQWGNLDFTEPTISSSTMGNP